jgi:hypothetical protein
MALILPIRSGGHAAAFELGVLPPWSQNRAPVNFSLSAIVLDSQTVSGTRQSAKWRRNANDASMGGMQCVVVSVADHGIGSGWSTVVYRRSLTGP